MKQGLLFLFVFTVGLLFSGIVQAEPLAPTIPTPANDSEYITSPLELDWEDVEGAQSYYYEITGITEEPILVTISKSGPLSTELLELLKPQHPYSWYISACKEENDGEDCGDIILEFFIIDELTYSWHVKSCEDIGGITCGDYGLEWAFTYLFTPPIISAPLNGGSTPIPVKLEWDSVAEAGSYLINWAPCPPWIEEEGRCVSLSVTPENGILESEYNDDLCLFTSTTPPTPYTWQVAACHDENENFCGAFSDFATFRASGFGGPLGKVELKQPIYYPFYEDDPNPEEEVGKAPSVLKTDFLEWSGPSCAYLYEIKITREGESIKITKFHTEDIQIENIQLGGAREPNKNKEEEEKGGFIEKLKDFWEDPDNLNETFSWTVTPCWGGFTSAAPVTEDCIASGESDEWKFKTTIETPELTVPINNASTRIPITLSWEKAIGAVSYKYEVVRFDNDTGTTATTYGVVSRESAIVEYEPGKITPDSSKQYKWRVQSCVDDETDIEKIDEKVCGDWSSSREFTTYDLLAPTDVIPVNGGEMFITSNVRWKKDDTANAYQYNLEYSCIDAYEDIEECLEYEIPICGDSGSSSMGEGSSLVQEKVTTLNHFSLPINCLGEYRFQVRSCIDEKCEELTTPENMSDAELFSFTTLQPPVGPGIVPCGRNGDDLGTPYNEREACQIKHVGFLIQNILDFVVWRLSLLILAGLLVLRVASIYLSFGSPTIVANIKTTLRGFLLGLSVLLFAWIIINLIMGLLGFQIQFFGRWWELPF